MSFGLVLSGGAARGAYAAGVMRFLFRDREDGGPARWPDVVAGASVGALNGVFAAARDPEGIRTLSRLWREMRIADVYRLDHGGLLRSIRATWAATSGAALLDASPLHALVEREAPWAALRRSVDGGRCRAFIVSVTQVDTGHNVLFVDSADADLDLNPMPQVRVERVQVRRDHLLASAALPLLFRPIQIGRAWFVDGGLRQNTPLRPAIMAGADRVLVVGSTSQPAGDQAIRHPDLTPNLPFLAGKALNALMADPVERDLRNVGSVNRIIAWGERAYGPGFRARIEAELGVRPVRTLFLRPSQDLGVLAAKVWRESPPELPTQVRWLLSTIADRANASDGESDLLSYLLFDRAFTAQVEEIGYQDAHALGAELRAFLDDGPAQGQGAR